MAFRFSEGQGLEQVLELAAGYGIGIGAGAVVTPFASGLAKLAWHQFPTMPVDAPTLAALARKGKLAYPDAAEAALYSGFDSLPFGRLYDATAATLGGPDVLELWRRGELTDAEAALWLGWSGLDERQRDRFAALKRNLPSVADLAMFRQQEFIDDATLYARAAVAGYTAEDADLFYRAAGLPPGIAEGLELLRRGKIDEARFAEYVAEGHTKTKYTGDLLELRYTPLSAAVAAMLLIRERIGQADAVRIAQENGLSEQDFLAWSSGLGRPPGIMEALTLVNRRVYGDPAGAEARAAFHEVVARSDVRTEYADALYELRHHYPTLFQVSRSLQAGTVTKQLAAETLRYDGYAEDWVQGIVNAHPGSAAVKVKELSAAIVDALYEAGIDSHPEALAALERLGYDQQEADLYLRVWLARRIVSELIRGVSLIRARYVGWKIDKPEAEKLLAELAGNPELAPRLFPLWDAEREADAPVLTHAQILQAFKYGRYTLDETLGSLQAQGYTPDDALTLAWIEAKGDPRSAAAPPPAGG